MKKKKGIDSSPQISEISDPETVPEIINKFGTYEIQPTADTKNDFPAIAQGRPKRKSKKG